MNSFLVMLADIDPNDLLAAQSPDSRVSEVLILFGSLIAAITVGAVWAVYYSKKKKRHKSRHHHQPDKSKDRALKFANMDPEYDPENQHRRRRRKHKRPHRPMNPTLAETRGLPPVRDANTPLPPMP